MTELDNLTNPLGRMILLVLGAALVQSPASAEGFGNDNQSCAVDEPCFQAAYQAGNKVIFEFNGVRGWDFYNVRYATATGETQVENRSGSFTLNNVRSNRIYTLKVQGCNSHVLARSTCTRWVEQSVTTK